MFELDVISPVSAICASVIYDFSFNTSMLIVPSTAKLVGALPESNRSKACATTSPRLRFAITTAAATPQPSASARHAIAPIISPVFFFLGFSGASATAFCIGRPSGSLVISVGTPFMSVTTPIGCTVFSPIALGASVPLKLATGCVGVTGCTGVITSDGLASNASVPKLGLSGFGVPAAPKFMPEPGFCSIKTPFIFYAYVYYIML